MRVVWDPMTIDSSPAGLEYFGDSSISGTVVVFPSWPSDLVDGSRPGDIDPVGRRSGVPTRMGDNSAGPR